MKLVDQNVSTFFFSYGFEKPKILFQTSLVMVLAHVF